MNRNAWIGTLSFCLAATLAGTNGCNPKADDSTTTSPKSDILPGTRIGTVDFDRVANNLRWTEELNLNVADQQKKLKTFYDNLKMNFTSQMKDRMKALGIKEDEKLEEVRKHATDAQLAELSGMRDQANQYMQMADQQLVQALQKYRNDWSIQYRNALNPTITQVARDKKVAAIFANSQLIFADSSIDLTDDIIAAARKTALPTVIPVKPLELPNSAPMIGAPSATQPAAATKPAN